MDFGRHEWQYPDREGRYPGGWSLRLRAMDAAKLGQLYLQGGTWDGRQIFAESFRQTVWTAGPRADYALGWWIWRDSQVGVPLYLASGWKGQRVFVYPTLDMTVVVISSLPDAEAPVMSRAVARHSARAGRTGYRPDPAAEQKLAAVALAGFRGTLRVDQHVQDHPGR